MLNQCSECGKFRTWDQLFSIETISMDINGGIWQEDYLICIPCRPHCCPDCGGKGIVYTVMDETEVCQPPRSSGEDCARCAPARAQLNK